jgi:hypothetical protein
LGFTKENEMNESQIKARIDTLNAIFVLKLKMLQPKTIQSLLKKKEARHG